MWSPASSILLLPPVLMNSLRSDYQISGCHYSPDTNGIFMKGKICNLSKSLLETKQFVCRWDVSASLSDCRVDWTGGVGGGGRMMCACKCQPQFDFFFFPHHVLSSGFNSNYCCAHIYLLIRLSLHPRLYNRTDQIRHASQTAINKTRHPMFPWMNLTKWWEILCLQSILIPVFELCSIVVSFFFLFQTISTSHHSTDPNALSITDICYIKRNGFHKMQ